MAQIPEAKNREKAGAPIERRKSQQRESVTRQIILLQRVAKFG
jgi:hypothetical protein